MRPPTSRTWSTRSRVLRVARPIKWLGDGVTLRFRDASDAHPVRRSTWFERAPAMGLPAHAGVAAGSAVFQDGDYFGRTVNLAARIAARATEGQTLVSQDVAELAETADVELPRVRLPRAQRLLRPDAGVRGDTTLIVIYPLRNPTDTIRSCQAAVVISPR